jgi:alpha-tubulin suppressor-like RCC1 family protein
MIKKIIFPLCYLIISIALTACGGGGGGGSSSAASSETESQTIAGTALDATGTPFVKGTDVLAVDSNGNVAGGKVKDEFGNFELTLTSIASSGKRFKGFGNVVLKVGGGSNSLTIVVPTSDGNGTIEINVNLIVSEASKQFLNDLDLAGLFDKVEAAVAKGGALGDGDLGSLDSIQKPITEAFLADSVKDLVLALLGPGASGIDFLSGSIKTTDTPFLQEAFTASKTITSLITTSVVGTGGSISPSATVLFNANATISIIPDAGFEVSGLLVDNIATPAALTYEFIGVIADHNISATFKKKTYSITNTSDANGTISASSTVEHGSTVTVAMAPIGNFEIATLTIDGKPETPVATYTFSPVTDNHTVVVTYQLKSYLISTAVVGGNGVITPSFSASHGSDATITITPSALFAVDKLTVDGTLIVPSVETYIIKGVTATHTVSVTFKAISFKVTNTSGANGSISASSTAALGTNVTVTIAASPGYLIDVLKVDGNTVTSTSTVTFNSISENHSVDVTFIAGYTVATSAGVNGIISATTTVLPGSDVIVTITPNAGFMVNTLTVDGSLVTSAKTYVFTKISKDYTISATFVASNIITATSDLNGSISPSGAIEVASGANQTFVITPKLGYVIDKLKVGGTVVPSVLTHTFTGVTSASTIDVTFKLIAYSITTSVVGGNGTISPSVTPDFGTNVDITLTPNTNYVVSSVTVDGILISPYQFNTYTFSSISQSHTISVTYALGKIITSTAGLGGTISPSGSINVVLGSNQIFTMVPNVGYNLGLLTVDASTTAGVGSYTFTNVTAAHTINTTFVIKKYNITTSVNNISTGTGIISPSLTAVDHFSEVVITLTPDPNCILGSLQVDGIPVTPVLIVDNTPESTPVYTYTIKSLDANHSVVVVYDAGFIISASAQDNGSITPKGDAGYLASTYPYFYIEAKPGYAIQDVLIDGAVDGANYSYYHNETSFYYYFDTLLAAHTIDVTFAVQQYEIFTYWDYSSQANIDGLGMVDIGSNKTVNIVPLPGFIIDYVSYADESEFETVVTVTDPTSVSISFTNVQSDYALYIYLKKDDRFVQNNILTLGTPASTTDFTIIKDYIGIAAGYDHSLGLKSNGSVIAWGGYQNGQVGTGLLSNIKAVSAGREHTLALDNSNVVHEVGNNTGLPNNLNDNISAIAAGYYHNLALRNGEVIAWGSDYSGELNVPASALTGITAIAAGEYYSMALKNGEVIAWGETEYNQTTIPVAAQTGVIAIAAGRYHAVALKSDGSVVAWGGDNSYGETSTESLSNVKAIAAGQYFTVALKNDGTVTVLGSSFYSAPVGLTDVTAIAASFKHILALKSDGSIIAWGYNNQPQNVSINTQIGGYGDPTKVPSFKVKSIVNGDAHIVALLDNGMVKASGGNAFGQTDIPLGLKDVSKIAAGENHTLALKANGEVVAWGSNSSNQSTIPLILKSVPGVVAIDLDRDALALKNDGTVIVWGTEGTWPSYSLPAGLTGVTAISVGTAHAVALKNDKTVQIWGNNSYQQQNVPEGLINVTAISAGDFHTIALKEDQTISVWGDNYFNQLDVPNLLNDVIAISAGGRHSLALKSDKTVVAWGDNQFNQINIPEGLSNVMAISTGFAHSVALKDDGTVVAWGNNGNNELNIPAGLSNVIAISAGSYHSLALKNDGTVVAWGRNTEHQADIPAGLSGVIAIAGGYDCSLALKSDGSIVVWGDDYYRISKLPKPSVKAITAGKNQSVALTSDGKVYVWGENGSGQSTVPNGLANVIDVAAGWNHTVALKSDGTVVAWGLNNRGQTTIPPAAVGIIAIAAGESHTVALKSDGTLVAWGDNSAHQLDIPLFQPRVLIESIDLGNNLNTPGLVPLNGIIAIAAGGNHTVALLDDGRVFAWGENDNSQSTIPSVLPPVKSISAGYDSTQLIFGGDIKDIAALDIYEQYVLSNNGSISNLFYNYSSYSFGIKKIYRGDSDLLALTSAGNMFYNYEYTIDDNVGIKNMSSGVYHGIALKDNGTLIGWGDNEYGEANTSGVTDAIDLAASFYVSTILKSNGTVESWGYYGFGQINVPPGLTNVVSISSRFGHTLALKGDGTVVSWGANDYGQCNVPVGLKDVIAIAAGYGHSLALKSDGTVVHWGQPSQDANFPSILSGIVAISAGTDFSMALKSDGTVIVWDNASPPTSPQ